ncbi:NAD(P)-binding domain-containing protein [uncultured Roseobacter sp.]|uniref:NAD(P)-binding domain-containing protein n=1 Tax=uncultured Roseobacter sp. TaxID=114847 RepID=UPI00261D935F|nr:NAD(P)-binding domain-containing protein [uncultured Roseobacter sp.]
MKRIGFIGTGHIAAPMARFLAGKGHPVTVSARNADVAAGLAASHGVAVADNQDVVDASDVVFLCVRPPLAQEVLQRLSFRSTHQIVSVMAGVPVTMLKALCAPAAEITVTIPLGYLEQGGCPLPGFPDGRVLRDLFEPENPVHDVATEDALNMHFAVCAMVPGILDIIATGSQWLGQRTGDAAAAETYATQLVSGYLACMARGAGRLAAERDSLATEGTISLQMTRALREGGAHDALTGAMNAIGVQLGEKR